jgi:hypothetical protein
VLETGKEKDWKRVHVCSQDSAQSSTPDSPVRQAGLRRTGHSRETLAAYGYNSLDCPVSQRSPAQRSAAKSAGDAWPAPTVEEMDPKGKGMVVNDKEKESFLNEPRDDKPTDSGSSHKKKDGKKKRRIKKIVYYDSDESSSSPRDDDYDEKKKPVNSNFSFDYSRIPYNSNAYLLSIPLGKPPDFDGEDYAFWSHKMRSHLFSLHPSIWEIVENEMQFDNTDTPVCINEQIHKNAQATTVLLASLWRDEYNKVSGLDNAKKIWDTLKISHEGNDATMITKMELVEDELGRFSMIRGEGPTQTYNRLKTLVNKIRSYGSTRWTDHDVVRLMLRSFTVIDPHLVNLIRENPRYTKMTPEEILGKFVSGRMMVKEA